MPISTPLPARFSSSPRWLYLALAAAIAGAAICSSSALAQAPSQTPAASPKPAHHAHRVVKKQDPAPVPQAPPPPPMPSWPINEKPGSASVVWDANGLRINASNSSLQQILSEVSTETGTKIEGLGADQRVYGAYGPGRARDVLSQLLQGSGYNFLLAGDIGQGAPREIVLSPRMSGSGGAPNGAVNRPQQDNSDEDNSEPQPEDTPQPPPPPMQNMNRQGFGPNGPNGPVRTPQQVMEEMQQRQQLQQQQMQEQQQQQQLQQQYNPPPQ